MSTKPPRWRVSCACTWQARWARPSTRRRRSTGTLAAISTTSTFRETRVPRPLQAFFYGQCVGAINRYMHDPHRDRRRPTLLLIDEYHMVARTESVARMAAELAKFARKHRIAVMPVDQNPHTFLGEKWTRSIWENATGKAIFHLDDLPAQEIGAAIGDLTPEHIHVYRARRAGRGGAGAGGERVCGAYRDHATRSLARSQEAKEMSMTAMLWKLHDVCADVSAARAMRGALTQHLMFTPAGLTSVLVQIGAEQAAYVLASGCAGCPNDQCVAGCRMDLLRRVVKASHPGSGLTLVRRGLLARPYARAVMAWPTSNADVLDADLLAGWSHARLLQHWRGGRGVQSTAVLLAVSADGDDPGGRLRTRGWKTCPLPWRDGWFDRLMMYALRRLTKRSLYKPYLLLPAPSAVRRAPRSTRSRTAATEADDAVAHDHAATIAAYVHAAGGRLELIDLASDERTARIHLNSTPAKDVATVWRDAGDRGGRP